MGSIAPKHQLWRNEGNRAKYWNFRIIETTLSIVTKFCTMIGATKRPLWVVQIRPKQIQAKGRDRHLGKSKKMSYICSTNWPILTTFGTTMHLGPRVQKPTRERVYSVLREVAMRPLSKLFRAVYLAAVVTAAYDIVFHWHSPAY